MHQDVVKALLAVAGVVVGAILAGVTNAYVARLKIREIEITYLQKLQDGYLENARKVSAEVYIPISIALTSLAASYERYRAWIDFENFTSPLSFRNDFEGECLRFLSDVADLMKRGADAYLTLDIDTLLQQFRTFLAQSLDATSVSHQFVFRGSVSALFIRSQFQTTPLVVTANKVGWLPPRMRMRFLGNEIGYSEEVVSAPLASRQFETRFQNDVTTLKSLIKEVTLGSRSRSG
jgi:hypothetical protein